VSRLGGAALLLLTLTACGATAAAHEEEQPAPLRLVAALPLRDLTGRPQDTGPLLEQLREGLEARGVAFVPEQEVEQALRRRRIRYTDSVSRGAGKALAEETGAEAILLGAVLERSAGPIPSLSVTARLVDPHTGRRLRSIVVALRGDDFQGLLGLGLVEDPDVLRAEVVVRMVAALDPASGLPIPPTPRVLDDPLEVFHAEGFDVAEVHKLLVLPLVSRTQRPDAGSLFAEILADALFQERNAQVVERSELIDAMVELGVRSVDGVDPRLLAEVGRLEGARWAILGSVDVYEEEFIQGGLRVPEVEAAIRLVDLDASRISAAARVHRRGDDYLVGLGLGIVLDPVDLADRTARELVRALGAS